MLKQLAALLLSLTCALTLFAAEPVVEPDTGVKFESERAGDASGVQLACTGAACRKKTALGVKVYAIAHWIDEHAARSVLHDWSGKSGADLASDQRFFDALCAADVEKRFRLEFVRNVSAKQIRDAFEESLQIVGNGKASPASQQFLALFNADIKKGDTLEIVSLPGGAIRALHNNAVLGQLEPDRALATEVWAIYFHEKLADNYLSAMKPKLIAQLPRL